MEADPFAAFFDDDSLGMQQEEEKDKEERPPFSPVPCARQDVHAGDFLHGMFFMNAHTLFQHTGTAGYADPDKLVPAVVAQHPDGTLTVRLIASHHTFRSNVYGGVHRVTLETHQEQRRIMCDTVCIGTYMPTGSFGRDVFVTGLVKWRRHLLLGWLDSPLPWHGRDSLFTFRYCDGKDGGKDGNNRETETYRDTWRRTEDGDVMGVLDNLMEYSPLGFQDGVTEECIVDRCMENAELRTCCIGRRSSQLRVPVSWMRHVKSLHEQFEVGAAVPLIPYRVNAGTPQEGDACMLRTRVTVYVQGQAKTVQAVTTAQHDGTSWVMLQQGRDGEPVRTPVSEPYEIVHHSRRKLLSARHVMGKAYKMVPGMRLHITADGVAHITSMAPSAVDDDRHLQSTHINRIESYLLSNNIVSKNDMGARIPTLCGTLAGDMKKSKTAGMIRQTKQPLSNPQLRALLRSAPLGIEEHFRENVPHASINTDDAMLELGITPASPRERADRTWNGCFCIPVAMTKRVMVACLVTASGDRRKMVVLSPSLFDRDGGDNTVFLPVYRTPGENTWGHYFMHRALLATPSSEHVEMMSSVPHLSWLYSFPLPPVDATTVTAAGKVSAPYVLIKHFAFAFRKPSAGSPVTFQSLGKRLLSIRTMLARHMECSVSTRTGRRTVGVALPTRYARMAKFSAEPEDRKRNMGLSANEAKRKTGTKSGSRTTSTILEPRVPLNVVRDTLYQPWMRDQKGGNDTTNGGSTRWCRRQKWYSHQNQDAPLRQDLAATQLHLMMLCHAAATLGAEVIPEVVITTLCQVYHMVRGAMTAHDMGIRNAIYRRPTPQKGFRVLAYHGVVNKDRYSVCMTGKTSQKGRFRTVTAGDKLVPFTFADFSSGRSTATITPFEVNPVIRDRFCHVMGSTASATPEVIPLPVDYLMMEYNWAKEMFDGTAPAPLAMVRNVTSLDAAHEWTEEHAALAAHRWVALASCRPMCKSIGGFAMSLLQLVAFLQVSADRAKPRPGIATSFAYQWKSYEDALETMFLQSTGAAAARTRAILDRVVPVMLPELRYNMLYMYEQHVLENMDLYERDVAPATVASRGPRAMVHDGENTETGNGDNRKRARVA